MRNFSRKAFNIEEMLGKLEVDKQVSDRENALLTGMIENLCREGKKYRYENVRLRKEVLELRAKLRL